MLIKKYTRNTLYSGMLISIIDLLPVCFALCQYKLFKCQKSAVFCVLSCRLLRLLTSDRPIYRSTWIGHSHCRMLHMKRKNSSYLNKNYQNRLIVYGCDKLSCSIHGVYINRITID